MKKVLLVTASLIALGAAAPAVAADLAARPYTKAPPMVAAVYDWTGFYIGANGGWGSSRNSWDLVAPFGWPEGSHDATGGTVGGQVGYRWQAGTFVFGLEAQGNWADFSGSNVSLLFPGLPQPHERRCVRPVHRSGRLCRQQRPALRQGRCCSDLEQLSRQQRCRRRARWRHRRRHPLGRHDRRRPRIRLRSELVGWRRVQSPVHAGPYLQLHHPGRRCLRRRPHPSGRRSRHRPRELQVRRPGGLASTDLAIPATNIEAPGIARGFFVAAVRPVNQASIAQPRAGKRARAGAYFWRWKPLSKLPCWPRWWFSPLALFRIRRRGAVIAVGTCVVAAFVLHFVAP